MACTPIQKFKLNLAQVEAIQWKGDCEGCIMDFIGGMTLPYDDGALSLATSRGELIAEVGDWIVKVGHNNFCVFSPEVFEEAFELIELK